MNLARPIANGAVRCVALLITFVASIAILNPRRPKTFMPLVINPQERSWIPYEPTSHFSLQNIPFGILNREGVPRVATRIGDVVIDLAMLTELGLIPDLPGVSEGVLPLDPSALSQLRSAMYELLEESSQVLRDDVSARERALISARSASMMMPFLARGYVDFYSGIHHASNVGKMFRPDMAPLLPNYRSLPVAYNGRASSLFCSGTAIQRPYGQIKKGDGPPQFAPTEELDFELEMGFVIGKSNGKGDPISPDRAQEYIAGFVLVNDWSARDVQRWEYQPLGPFLAKSFGTSVSPWIVTPDALEPFRCQGMEQVPAPLDYLQHKKWGHFKIELEISLRTKEMSCPEVISKTDSLQLYWSFGQQLAHQTSNNTPIEPGDLFASGTISSESAFSDAIGGFGSLLELTYRGSKPIKIGGSGVERGFLQDGDEVAFSGYCQGDGFRVGFGEVEGEILPAVYKPA